LEPGIIFGRGLEDLQLRTIVEAEAQMLDTDQIQQKIVLKRCVLSASVRSPKKNLTYRDQLRIGLVMGSGPEAQNYIT
jgi:hypothetical protein